MRWIFLVAVYPLEACDFKKINSCCRLTLHISIGTKTQAGWAEQSPKLAGGNSNMG